MKVHRLTRNVEVPTIRTAMYLPPMIKADNTLIEVWTHAISDVEVRRDGTNQVVRERKSLR
jgi:hypothetical protein